MLTPHRKWLSACVLFFSMLSTCLADGIGSITAVTPGATVERSGQATPLQKKDALYLNDVIRTDATGRVQVFFNDDSTVTIGKNTMANMRDFAASGPEPKFHLHITKGIARIITGKVVEANPAGFAVTTPEAAIGIRGTIIVVFTENGQTTVYVENTYKKEVYVNSIRVKQNHKITVPGTRLEPEPMTPEDWAFIRESTAALSPAASADVALVTGQPFATPDSEVFNPGLVTQTTGDKLTGAVTGQVTGILIDTSGNAFANGAFSFDVNIATGAINNASMSAPISGLGLIGYDVSGGSGSMAGGVSGFSGTISSGGGPMFTVTPADATNMTGLTGDLSAVGNAVTGNFNIEAPGWPGAANGPLSGNRTQ